MLTFWTFLDLLEPTVARGLLDIKNIGMDTCYSCKSEDLIESGDVNITLWDVQMQAFISDGNKSSESKYASCDAAHPGCSVLYISVNVFFCFLLAQ